MENLKMEITNLALGFIDKIQMPVSIIQIFALLIFLGVCVYSGHQKIGFIVSFFTISYWVYVSNKVWLFEIANGSFYGMFAAITVGMAIAFIGFVGLFEERR